MLHVIKRIDGSVICEIEAETYAAAVSEAARRDVVLDNADFRYAEISGASLDGASIFNANFNRAALRAASLKGSVLDGANFNYADLRDADFEGASLAGASLLASACSGMSIIEARINGAVLLRESFVGAKITAEHSVSRLLARAASLITAREFFLWSTDKGPMITGAGARAVTVDEYRRRITARFGGDDASAETARILDYFDAAWAAHKGGN